jgi:hypothetical protein
MISNTGSRGVPCPGRCCRIYLLTASCRTGFSACFTPHWPLSNLKLVAAATTKPITVLEDSRDRTCPPRAGNSA